MHRDRAAVNSMKAIAANPRFVSINSAIEIDLTGQVVADSIGPAIYSGVGGQPDFVRAAQASFDGRGISVIALPSTTSKGHSRIVPILQPGAGAFVPAT
jgi:acyl-CoA hydrolase